MNKEDLNKLPEENNLYATPCCEETVKKEDKTVKSRKPAAKKKVGLLGSPSKENLGTDVGKKKRYK